MFRRFLPIILLVFVNVIGFTLLIPVLPETIERFVSDDISGVIYGGLISVYAMCQFLAAPVLGTWSDRYGRKPILFVSQLGTLLSWVFFGAAYFIPENLEFLGLNVALLVIFFSRVIDGLTGGNISVANAWVSDSTSRQEKTKAFGMLGGVFGFGLLIGPVLGGFSGATEIGFLGTAITAFLISFVTLLFIYFYLPESLKKENREEDIDINFWQQINFFNKLKPFRDNRFVLNILHIRFFFDLAFSAYTTVIILLLGDKFELSVMMLGLLLSMFGFFAIFNQVYVVGKVAKWQGDVPTLYIGLILLFLGLITIPLIPASINIGELEVSVVVIAVNGFFINLGASLIMPTSKSLLTSNVSTKKQGAIIGLNESVLSFANGLTPVIAGTLYAMFGSYTFVLYALLLTFPHLYLWVREKKVVSVQELQT